MVAALPMTSRVRAATEQKVWDLLARVPDPEIPVISVVDLGIVREVECVEGGDSVVVTVTPTYSGCPATEVIAQAICDALSAAGIASPSVRTRISPAWTTDWLSEAGRKRLREYGIAPPVGRAAREHLVPISQLFAQATDPIVQCPRCDSKQARKVSEFGSTPCKALYQCESCKEPFDYFKCH